MLEKTPIFNVLANIGTLWLLYNLLDSAFCGCLCSACSLFQRKSCQQILKLDQPSSEPVKIVLFMPNSGVPKDPDPCLPGERRQIKSLPPSPILHSLVEMKVWRLWLLISSCSLIIARVQTTPSRLSSQVQSKLGKLWQSEPEQQFPDNIGQSWGCRSMSGCFKHK